MSDNGRKWMIDASAIFYDGLFAFCPVELADDGSIESIVTGLTMISDEPPNGEPCIGLFHDEGQEAADAFYAKNKSAVDALMAISKDESCTVPDRNGGQ